MLCHCTSFCYWILLVSTILNELAFFPFPESGIGMSGMRVLGSKCELHRSKQTFCIATCLGESVSVITHWPCPWPTGCQSR